MNNEGLVDVSELRKIKDKANFHGKSAYCFIHGNKIIKVYANSDDECYIALDKNKICDFSKYKSDTIVFPDEYLYENDTKAGEVMNFIKDDIICFSLDDETKVKSLIKHFEKAQSDILVYSDILMRDLCSANILYSNELGFHIIDTTEWKINKDVAPVNLYQFNSSIVKTIFEYLDIPLSCYYDYFMLDLFFKKNLAKYGKPGDKLVRLLEGKINHYCNVEDLIYVYMSLYEKHNGKELKTLDDMKEMTKVLKKG